MGVRGIGVGAMSRKGEPTFVHGEHIETQWPGCHRKVDKESAM